MYTCINAHIYLYVCMYVCMFIYLRSSMVIQLVRDHEEWNTPRAGRRSLRDGPEGGGGREPGAMPGAGGGPNQNSNSKKLPALYVSEGPRATGGDGTSQTTNQPPPPGPPPPTQHWGRRAGLMGLSCPKKGKTTVAQRLRTSRWQACGRIKPLLKNPGGSTGQPGCQTPGKSHWPDPPPLGVGGRGSSD